MTWIERAMTATDYWEYPGGFAAEVLWVGTDGQSPTVTWVEAGITQGWHQANVTTLYTAHGDNRVTPHIFFDHRWNTPVATVGATYTFAGFYNTTNTYRTTVNPPSGNSWDWSGHNPPTAGFAGGSESTCPAPSQVSKTFVSASYQRRQSDHAYLLPTDGFLFNTDSGGGVAWCNTYFSFRYWMNDSNSSGCS